LVEAVVDGRGGRGEPGGDVWGRQSLGDVQLAELVDIEPPKPVGIGSLDVHKCRSGARDVSRNIARQEWNTDQQISFRNR
jgi:hypothetical protein